jgi:hypothetical protein
MSQAKIQLCQLLSENGRKAGVQIAHYLIQPSPESVILVASNWLGRLIEGSLIHMTTDVVAKKRSGIKTAHPNLIPNGLE